MKNRDFIKKSIKENIVDHNAVLNNLKAKAMQIDSENTVDETKQKMRFGIGLKRAALIFTVLILTASCVFTVCYLYDPEVGVVPPDISDLSDTYIVNNNNSDIVDSENSQDSQSEQSKDNVSDIDEDSREPSGNDESDDNITSTSLDAEDVKFFADFAKNLITYQKLINGELEYDFECVLDGYATVLDSQFQNRNYVEKFLYSFLTPSLAAEKYNSLIEGDNPLYREIDGVLYVLIDNKDVEIIDISTETAYLAFKSENTLEVSAMLKMNSAQNYYLKFRFVMGKSGWLYADDWNENDFLDIHIVN